MEGVWKREGEEMGKDTDVSDHVFRDEWGRGGKDRDRVCWG